MIYKIYATKDTTITNAQVTAGAPMTGSNAGASQVLDLYKVAGLSGSSVGVAGTASLTRILMLADLSQFAALTASKSVPTTGVQYFLRLRSANVPRTQPSSYSVQILPMSRSWDEGKGLDLDDWLDHGNANWQLAQTGVPWTTPGGDTLSSLSSAFYFDTGFEDIEANVTPMVNAWLTGGLQNFGLMVKLSASHETDGLNYYIKRFFSAQTNLPDKRPCIEARWDDSVKDDRANFVFDYSGSLYLYHKVRGAMTDLPGVNSLPNVLTVKVRDAVGNLVTTVSASYTGLAGTYSASFAIVSSSTYSGTLWTDAWSSGSKAYMTGAFALAGHDAETGNDDQQVYQVKIKNLKQRYETDEVARMALFTRPRDYNPTAVLTQSVSPAGIVLTKAYYRVDNDATNEVVIGFGTGSTEYTRLSYDQNGNWFNLYMQSFAAGNVYRIMLMFDVDGQKQVIDTGQKFKVY